VAALTPGFTGADLANLVNEARSGGHPARGRAGDPAGLHRAIEAHRRRPGEAHPHPVTAGAEGRRPPRDGHALVAAALPGSDPVHKVSIIPRGVGALGYTIQRPTEDRT
jgi:cell division protease FtsH